MTKAQAKALEEQIESFQVNPTDIVAQAGGPPLGIEIGFGMGQALVQWAQAAPHWYLVGIELYQPGIGALAHQLNAAALQHVGVVEQPAQAVLAALPNQCIDEVRIFFPDPWPKKRHAKRRLIQPGFVIELARVLKPAGIVHLATDWQPYADWMRECFKTSTEFVLQTDHIRQAGDEPAAVLAHGSDSSQAGRQITKFEARGERLGHDIHDLIYERVG